MARRKLLLTFSIGALVGCAVGTGPPEDPGKPPGTVDQRVELNELRWRPTVSPRVFDAKGDMEVVPLLRSASAASAVRYEVSFWAVKGSTRSVEITYSDDKADGESLLLFTVGSDALGARPDGTPFAQGDSVMITVSFDTNEFLAEFQPAGLTFNVAAPAIMEFWYAGANDDYDNDGDVDDDDDFIESEMLDVWYRGDGASYWAPLGATHSLMDKRYRLSIEHFSSYAVSW